MLSHDEPRLAASEETAAPPKGKAQTCLECGATFSRPQRVAEFCSTPCRKSWNNRRMMRGAELYDLMMALRYQRDEATKHKVWRILNRMTAQFRDEDKRERAGRRSWQRIRAVLERNVSLTASIHQIGRKKRNV